MAFISYMVSIPLTAWTTTTLHVYAKFQIKTKFEIIERIKFVMYLYQKKRIAIALSFPGCYCKLHKSRIRFFAHPIFEPSFIQTSPFIQGDIKNPTKNSDDTKGETN